MSWVVCVSDMPSKAWDKRAGMFTKDGAAWWSEDFCYATLSAAEAAARAIARARRLSVWTPWRGDPRPAAVHVSALHRKAFLTFNGHQAVLADPYPETWETRVFEASASPLALGTKFAHYHGIVPEDVLVCPTSSLVVPKSVRRDISGCAFVWVGNKSGEKLGILGIRFYGRQPDRGLPVWVSDDLNPWAGETFRCGPNGAWLTPSPTSAPILSEVSPGQVDWAVASAEESYDRVLTLSHYVLGCTSAGSFGLPAAEWDGAWQRASAQGEMRALLSNQMTPKGQRLSL